MGDALVQALREALYLTILVAAPPLLAALVVGLAMAVVRAAFRIEERALEVVPRIGAALLALAVAGPWIAAQFMRFTAAMIAALPTVGHT